MYKFKLKHHNSLSTNLLNPDKVVQGRYMNDLGNVFTSPFNAHSPYLEVIPGQTYKFNFAGFGTMTAYCYFDENKSYVVGGMSGSFTQVTVPNDADIKYIIVSFTSLLHGLDPKDLSITLGASSTFSSYYEYKDIHPIYKSLTREYEKQSSYQFYREKLSGNLKLINKEYDYLDNLDFDQEVFLEIEDTTGKLPLFKGKFFKTDCSWDADDRTVEIRVDTNDDYELVLAGLEKTFNLINIAPKIEEITLRKRPILQVYIAGDNVITNILGGTYWEQEIQVDPQFNNDTLISAYKFANVKNIRFVPSDYAPMLSTDITGEYNASLVNLNGLYKVTTETITLGTATLYRYSIRKVSNNQQLYVTSWTTINKPSINYLPFFGTGGQTGTFYFTEYRIYVRLYTDALTMFTPSQNTYALPSTDIVENTRNYKRAIPYSVDTFEVYDQFTVTANRFGKVPDGTPSSGKYYKEYLVDPITGLSNPLPISSSNWKAVSLWFFNNSAVRSMEFKEATEFQLRDAYPVGSVIKTLLEQLESTVKFEESEEHSYFLYSSMNPIASFNYLEFGGDGETDESAAGNINLFITPKTNIVVGNYDQPARKADITLGQMLDMLRDTLKLYWHISNNKLIIEHISYYQKGLTYGTPIVGSDLTALYNPNNGLSWGFSQNKWEYDKENMPERFEFDWMDDVSIPFQGYPIVIRSNFVQKGRIENITVNGFTTDIDFIMATPGAISKDGFVLLGTIMSIDGANTVPFIKKDLGNNKKIIMQNGLLSWPVLHENFYAYDLPATKAIINDINVVVPFTISRFKKQEVVYPFTTIIDPYKLVKTALGDGQIDKMSINLESLLIKATIKHDTE